MNEIQAFVGLDVHKETISVAVTEAGRDGEVRSWGSIPHDRTSYTLWENYGSGPIDDVGWRGAVVYSTLAIRFD